MVIFSREHSKTTRKLVAELTRKLMEPFKRVIGEKTKNKDYSKQLIQMELNFVSTMLMTKKMENIRKEIALDLIIVLNSIMLCIKLTETPPY